MAFYIYQIVMYRDELMFAFNRNEFYDGIDNFVHFRSQVVQRLRMQEIELTGFLLSYV